MNLNCRCVLKYFVLVYSGMCWVLNKICRFKCGNNNKSETTLKKTAYQASVHTRTEAKSVLLASGATKTEAKRLSNFFFFKKRSPYGLGCIQNRGQKGIEKSPYGLGCTQNRGQRGIKFKKKKRSPYGLGWNVKPRQKGTLWLRFLTEAKSYDLLASPQYAWVPEPVQNIENNRCQRPFLHWCIDHKKEWTKTLP